jgi:rhodanese-related sulfurtransferase
MSEEMTHFHRDHNEITCEDLESIQNGALVDVREPDEFAAGTIESAINIPLSKLQAGDFSAIPTTRPLVLFCQAGRRSLTARDLLMSEGFTGKIWSLEGGYKAYVQYKH